MKRSISFILVATLVCLLFSTKSFASRNLINVETIIEDNNVYYIETVIEEKTSDNCFINFKGATKNKTASKTVSYKDSHQNVLWSVSVTASFTYNNKTSKCNSCSHQASSNSNSWSIKNSSSSYSGNSATATATARQNVISGKEKTLSVTISCSSSGEIK